MREFSSQNPTCKPVYSRFPVGCPKIATRIHACAKFPIQNSRPSARMRGFSSRFLDNQLEIDCSVILTLRAGGGVSAWSQGVTLIFYLKHTLTFVIILPRVYRLLQRRGHATPVHPSLVPRLFSLLGHETTFTQGNYHNASMRVEF